MNWLTRGIRITMATALVAAVATPVLAQVAGKTSLTLDGARRVIAAARMEAHLAPSSRSSTMAAT